MTFRQLAFGRKRSAVHENSQTYANQGMQLGVALSVLGEREGLYGPKPLGRHRTQQDGRRGENASAVASRGGEVFRSSSNEPEPLRFGTASVAAGCRLEELVKLRKEAVATRALCITYRRQAANTWQHPGQGWAFDIGTGCEAATSVFRMGEGSCNAQVAANRRGESRQTSAIPPRGCRPVYPEALRRPNDLMSPPAFWLQSPPGRTAYAQAWLTSARGRQQWVQDSLSRPREVTGVK
jgi:hypothetical protein